MNNAEETLYQRIKDSIKESQLDLDENTFTPLMRITLEIPIEPILDTQASIGKQKIYELIGKAICERWEPSPTN
jgi:hypothetical protein